VGSRLDLGTIVHNDGPRSFLLDFTHKVEAASLEVKQLEPDIRRLFSDWGKNIQDSRSMKIYRLGRSADHSGLMEKTSPSAMGLSSSGAAPKSKCARLMAPAAIPEGIAGKRRVVLYLLPILFLWELRAAAVALGSQHYSNNHRETHCNLQARKSGKARKITKRSHISPCPCCLIAKKSAKAAFPMFFVFTITIAKHLWQQNALFPPISTAF